MIYTDEQVERTIEAIGLSVEDELADDFIIFCPYHFNVRTPAGEVSKERGTFYCFSCGQAATLEKLVMHVTQRSYFEATRLIDSKRNESNVMTEITKTLAKSAEDEPFDQDLLDRLHKNLLQNSTAQKYLASRWIDGGIDKFELGYSIQEEMVIVPVHTPNGMPLGFVGRSIEGKRFKNSSGLRKSRTLFNLHRVKTSPLVVVVESSFDVIRLDLVGLPSVATLGAGVSAPQLELLDKYFNHVVIVPDADQAGTDMRDKLKKGLGDKLTSIKLPSGAKDVGDLSNIQLKILGKYIDNPIACLV